MERCLLETRAVRYSGKDRGFRARDRWLHIPTLPLTFSVPTGVSVILFVTQFHS